MADKLTYAAAVHAAFTHLLGEYPEVFVVGQGLWSPWYVGSTMTDLDKEFGPDRVIDTPVSELGCTGMAVGASLCGYRPIIVHPRMDFMLLAMDPIVNQAAKWSHMLGGQAHPAVTIRGIINRGGEQGAQHSQALHAWFAHIPGLRVVMPSTVEDARDLLIAAALCDDPVLYIDDRWLYDRESTVGTVRSLCLEEEGSQVVREGSDLTLVGAGFAAYQCEQAADCLHKQGISAEVVDLRVINPLKADRLIESVIKTGRLCVVDGGWSNCGLAGEVMARVAESVDPRALKSTARRVTLPPAPAPSAKVLEAAYYPVVSDIVSTGVSMMMAESRHEAHS